MFWRLHFFICNKPKYCVIIKWNVLIKQWSKKIDFITCQSMISGRGIDLCTRLYQLNYFLMCSLKYSIRFPCIFLPNIFSGNYPFSYYILSSTFISFPHLHYCASWPYGSLIRYNENCFFFCELSHEIT